MQRSREQVGTSVFPNPFHPFLCRDKHEQETPQTCFGLGVDQCAITVHCTYTAYARVQVYTFIGISTIFSPSAFVALHSTKSIGHQRILYFKALWLLVESSILVVRERIDSWPRWLLLRRCYICLIYDWQEYIFDRPLNSTCR